MAASGITLPAVLVAGPSLQVSASLCSLFLAIDSTVRTESSLRVSHFVLVILGKACTCINVDKTAACYLSSPDSTRIGYRSLIMNMISLPHYKRTDAQ